MIITRKRILILVGCLVAIILVATTCDLIFNYKTITIENQTQTKYLDDIKIIGLDGKVVATTNLGSSIRVRNGSYRLLPETNNYSIVDPNITVSLDEVLPVQIIYTDEFLSTLLTDQLKTDIKQPIASDYDSNKISYVIKKYQLFADATYCGVILQVTLPGEPGAVLDNGDVTTNPDVLLNYRLLLQKSDNSWNIVGYPALIMTSDIATDVPQYILEKLNYI